ncbi:MAG: hypothetical protein ABEI13_00980, partial [Candidatus Paceibacteria bacterium]
FVDHKYGLFFLRGRDELVYTRHTRTRVSGQRFRRVRRFQKLLRSAPFVRSLFLAGSGTISNSKETSDIDFFVVTAENRIWTARFFLTLMTHIRGIRRHGDKEANRMCLNHYVSETNLTRTDHDVYAAHLYGTLIPLTPDDAYLQAFHEQNQWIKTYYPHIIVQSHQMLTDTSKPRLKQLCETLINRSIGDMLEHGLRRLQQAKIQTNPPEAPDRARVDVSDLELEFHPQPHGPRISHQLQERVRNLSA